jgi:hypothetical protein
MKGRIRLAAVAACLALLACAVAPQPARAQSGLSLSNNRPDGVNDRVAAGRDYATETLGDPWDMNDTTDINLNESGGISGAAYSNGVFSATAAADPSLFLLDPGIASSQRQGKTGKTFPIDTTLYHVLTVRMNVSVASSAQVFWYTDTQGGPFAATAFVATTPGWHVYTIDLATAPIVAGTVTSWSGQPATGLRFDPTVATGSTFQIDWVRLTATGDASTSYTTTFTASDAGSNAAIDLYLDDDATFSNGYVDRVATNLREDTATSAPIQLATYAPGNYFVIGRLSRDYASLALENPWDMNDAADVSSTNGFSSASVSGGVFSGTTSSNDPFFTMNVPLTGPNLIDAAVFRSISFQMTLSSAQQFQIFWQNEAGNVFSTNFISASAGSNVYTVDLGAQANWTGRVRQIRIDPATMSGVTVSVGWVSVNTGGALSAEPVTVTSASPGPLNVSTPPIARLLQPDAAGGLDFASFVRNNPWNMAEVSDIQLTTGLAATFPQFLTDSTEPGGVRGDYLKGRNANNDPAVFWLFNNTASPIDANRFKNLTFRMFVQGPRNVGAGSVARVFWQRTTGAAAPQSSDDIIVNDGLNTYQFDLPTILKEPTDPNNNGTPWSGTVKYFRIDPHEFTTQRDFYFDDVKIAADDEANGRFAIAWSATDPDDDAQISLFYDTNNTGFDGTLIASGLSENDANNVYTWDTRGVANGTYFLYAVITDGLNTTRRYATGRLVVNNPGAADTTKPFGALETTNTVTSASGVVNVQGWALDNVQIASVQLLVDGTPVARPTTGIFRPDVRNANPSFPDCSESGFQTSYNASGLGQGTHSLTVAVYDTAGNRALLGGAASGQETVGIYIPATGAFFLKNSNAGGAADVVFTFGPTSSTLTPLVGDWDGDGVETIGLYNPATGAFFMKNSNAGGGADIVFSFGPAGLGWRPVTGDWNGDGVDTIGLYDPSTGNFFLKNTNAPGAADLTFGFGGGGATPLAGDWNGDGVDTVGLYNPGAGTFFLRNTNAPGPADVTFSYGPANSVPLAGDWNNDGVDTPGIYVPATGAWFLRNSNSAGPADIVFTFGPSNVTPITGDWNGSTPKW